MEDVEKILPDIKNNYEFHHKNLLHIFNFFATTGETLKFHIGKTIDKNFKDNEIVHLLIMENFNSDLEENIKKRKQKKLPFT